MCGRLDGFTYQVNIPSGAVVMVVSSCSEIVGCPVGVSPLPSSHSGVSNGLVIRSVASTPLPASSTTRPARIAWWSASGS